jgi:eukaryotic-like serine/threonine-protein kinase
MGVVYRARDLALERDVAVKLLQDGFPADSPVARRFTDEARITGQLQHPGIPAMYQVGGVPDGRPFLAMKLIKGRTLAALLGERPDPAADRGRFVAIFEHVCQAVAYAHSLRGIHRDLKPSNVMVGKFGEVQVMDWGLAKVLTARGRAGGPPATALETSAGTAIRPARDADQETQAGSLLGTPAFVPPGNPGPQRGNLIVAQGEDWLSPIKRDCPAERAPKIRADPSGLGGGLAPFKAFEAAAKLVAVNQGPSSSSVRLVFDSVF